MPQKKSGTFFSFLPTHSDFPHKSGLQIHHFEKKTQGFDKIGTYKERDLKKFAAIPTLYK